MSLPGPAFLERVKSLSFHARPAGVVPSFQHSCPNGGNRCDYFVPDKSHMGLIWETAVSRISTACIFFNSGKFRG